MQLYNVQKKRTDSSALFYLLHFPPTGSRIGMYRTLLHAEQNLVQYQALHNNVDIGGDVNRCQFC